MIRDVLLAQQPNKMFATVEEMGALAVFLSGPGATSITGTALPVDGGWTAHLIQQPQEDKKNTRRIPAHRANT